LGVLESHFDIGVFVQSAGLLFFVWNMIRSAWKGQKAGDDPWDAWTLEWATTSPPASYNFESFPKCEPPSVWDLKHPNDPDWKHE
jgi:Heme/copper-type cytochrome/quinol oxidases, subunit 1